MTYRLHMQGNLTKYLPYIAWMQVLVATFGSLYASELLKLPPCSLCWYQRIFMFPLAIIIPVGIMTKDNKLPYYVIPLSGLGAFFAFWHVLLQEGLISESVTPCAIGVSCLEKYGTLLGFITFPMLSMLAFLVVLLLMVLMLRGVKK